MDFHHKEPVMPKAFPCPDVIMDNTVAGVLLLWPCQFGFHLSPQSPYQVLALLKTFMGEMEQQHNMETKYVSLHLRFSLLVTVFSGLKIFWNQPSSGAQLICSSSIYAKVTIAMNGNMLHLKQWSGRKRNYIAFIRVVCEMHDTCGVPEN